MRKWVVLGIVGLLVFGNLVFAGGWDESDLQVSAGSKTCNTCNSCQEFDVDKVLNEVNLEIENLTRVINQKGAELQGLYQKAKISPTNESLDRILMLETELAYKRADLLFYQAQKQQVEMYKKYTRKTSYGVEVLYYKLPKKDEIVEELTNEINPAVEDPDFDWFISAYLQAYEMTGFELLEKLFELRNLIEKAKKGEASIEDLMKWKAEFKKLEAKRDHYGLKYSELDTLQELYMRGRYQTILKSALVQLSSISWGIPQYQGESCWPSWWYCPSKEEPLIEESPSEPTSWWDWVIGTYYMDAFEPVLVWVGIYSSETPNRDYFIGEECTTEFPEWHRGWEVRKYWNDLVDDYPDMRSIQVKLFYTAKLPSRGYKRYGMIWLYNCNEDECWLTSINEYLPSEPNIGPPDGYYDIVTTPNAKLSCCKTCPYGGSCTSCRWCNRHCDGCFACDPTGRQYFAAVGDPSEYRQRNIWP